MRWTNRAVSGQRVLDQATSPERLRPRRQWRPGGIQPLEGRALLAVSPVVATFNGGQPVVTPAGLTTPPSTNQNDAVAVQSDGKIVVVGQGSSTTGPTAGVYEVAVTRYNANGTLDTTFGTGGQTLVPLTLGTATNVAVASSVVIQPNGAIVFDANLTQIQTNFTYSRTVPVAADVIRVTATGALDTTFGSGGIATLTADTPSVANLALGSGNTILLDGLAANPSQSGTSTLFVSRLATNGTLDPTFNAGAFLFPSTITAPSGTFTPAIAGAIGLTSAGKIKVVTEYENQPNNSMADEFGTIQLNTDGSLDSTYGTAGVAVVPTTLNNFIEASALLPTGQVVIAANTEFTSTNTLVRLNADGTLDTTFGTIPLSFIDMDLALAVAADGSIAVSGGQSFSPFGGSVPNTVGTLTLDITRVTAAGQVDSTFGPGGTVSVSVPLVPNNNTYNTAFITPGGLAFTASGQVVLAGTTNYVLEGIGMFATSTRVGSQGVLALVGATNHLNGANGDYDGDNKSDLAAELTNLGVFAYRKSTGGDVVQPFGPTGTGQSIPAPGDYDGDGKTDVALYLPAYGVLAYRPSGGGADVLTRFGPTGVGNAIPVPGDYNGDGKTDVALFLPGSATFIIDPSGGGAPYAVQFGAPGTGQSIPLPGDYDGSHKTELGVYLPALGALVYRSATTNQDNTIPFGPTGLGASIPVVGDYNGDGRADLALYLPSTGTFAVDPSGGLPYAVQFGAPGAGASLPIVGDFDGDGKTDLAVYLPNGSVFAYRPSGGKLGDQLAQFGGGGSSTVPAAALAGDSLGGTVRTASLDADPAAANLVVYLPDDLPGTRKKPTA